MRLSKQKELALIASGRIKLPAEKRRVIDFGNLPEKPKRKPAHTPGKMNETEERWAARIAEAVRVGHVQKYRFESLKFRLADRTTYTPDFEVILHDGSIELHEIKGGHIREKNWIKFKMARELYPEFRWRLFQLIDNCWSEK